MSKKFVSLNGINFILGIIKQAIDTKLGVGDVVDSVDSTDGTKALSAKQGKLLSDRIDDINISNVDGAMSKSIYDTDDDGIVDNANALEGHGADYFAKADDHKMYITEIKGQANGLAPLNAAGMISADYLPAYVDEIIEGYYSEETGKFYSDEDKTEEIVSESAKIYVDISTNTTYRFSGTVFVVISSSSDLTEITNEELQGMWDSIQ